MASSDDKGHVCDATCAHLHGKGMSYTPTTERSVKSVLTAEAVPAADNAASTIDALFGAPKEPPKKTPRKPIPMTKLLDTLAPAATHEETFSRGVHALLALDEKFHKSGVHPIEEKFEAIVKHLKDAAKAADKTKAKELGALVNILEGANAFFDDIRDHHAGDEKMLNKARAVRNDLATALEKFSGDHAGLVEGLTSRMKQHSIPIPGTLMRDATIPMHREYAAQVSEHFASKGIFGKAMNAVGGTVSLGVIAHGGLNMKRGLFGYQDPESGEHKSGALSTFIVGAGEMAAGLASLKKALTGRWGFSRATHEAAHHHHDHDHGHHHH